MQSQSNINNEDISRTCSRIIRNGCSKTEPIPCRCDICEEEEDVRHAERMYTESTWRMYYRIIAARKLSTSRNQEPLTTNPRQPLVVIEDTEKDDLQQHTSRPKNLENNVSFQSQNDAQYAGEHIYSLHNCNDKSFRLSNGEKLQESCYDGRYVSDESSLSSMETSNDDEYNIFTLDLDY